MQIKFIYKESEIFEEIFNKQPFWATFTLSYRCVYCFFSADETR